MRGGLPLFQTTLALAPEEVRKRTDQEYACRFGTGRLVHSGANTAIRPTTLLCYTAKYRAAL